jgi:predicted nucleotidyltransferase
MSVTRAGPVLRRITELIVRSVDPELVLLFGSAAKGLDGPDSDLDLLVVGNFAGPRHRRGRELRGLLDRYPVRIDLHLLTPAEVAAGRRDPRSWLATLHGHAQTLYRSPPGSAKTPKKERTPSSSDEEVQSNAQKPFYDVTF